MNFGQKSSTKQVSFIVITGYYGLVVTLLPFTNRYIFNVSDGARVLY